MKKILVVDDDAMNVKMAEMILQKENYEVLKAYSGMECLIILQNEKVDMVLLDVEMPMMSGLKTLEIIRENCFLKDLPVMFLTADSSFDTVNEAGKLGVEEYVKKPFLPADLLERVKKIVGQ